MRDQDREMINVQDSKIKGFSKKFMNDNNFEIKSNLNVVMNPTRHLMETEDNNGTMPTRQQNTKQKIQKSMDFSSQANKAASGFNQEYQSKLEKTINNPRGGGLSSFQNIEEPQENDTSVDTMTKNMLESSQHADNQSPVFNRHRKQSSKSKGPSLAQRLRFGKLIGDQNDEDRKTFESNPKIVQRHHSIQTQLQIQNNVGLSSPARATNKNQRGSVAEKLFSNLSKSHIEKLSFIQKIKRKINCSCACLHKKQKVKQHQQDLLSALRSMTMKYQKKQQRTDQLWRKVRALVHSGMFIQKIKSSTNQRLKREQTGISYRRQVILEKKMSLLKMSENKYLSLIKQNSTFKIVWEFVIALVFIITFWIIPLNIATLFLPYEDMQSFEILIDFVIILDILVNFISEGVTAEGETIIYLRQSAVMYLKSYFLLDFISVIPLLLSWESNTILYYFKLARFVRIKRFFNFFKHLKNLIEAIFHSTVNKPKISRTIELFKIVLIYYFIFHLHSCIWHYLGITNSTLTQTYGLHNSQNYQNSTNQTKGWISLVMNGTVDYSKQDYIDIYLRSQFFIISSFATVGYGDIHGTDQNEFLFVIYILMIGQLLFSFFTGKLKAAMLKVDNLELQSIKNDIIETVELFLMKFSRIRGARTFKKKEIKNVLEHVDASFQFNFKSIKKEKFYKILSPKLQQELVFHLFGHYQSKLLYFFEDFDSKYKAGDNFIFQVLSNLQCVILTPGQVVTNYQENFSHLYFIVHGGVTLYDKYKNFLVQYVSGSNFGDFQLILGLKSQYIYKGTLNRTSYLLSLEKDVFLKALSQDYDAFCYLTKIALRRRKDLKGLASELQQKAAELLRLKNKEKNKIHTLSYDSPKSQDANRMSQIFNLQNQSLQQDSSFQSQTDQLLNVPALRTHISSSANLSSPSRNDMRFTGLIHKKLKVLQLLQIRCQMQNNRFIGYFLEDLNLEKHISSPLIDVKTKSSRDLTKSKSKKGKKFDVIQEEKKESSDESLLDNFKSDDSDSSFVQSDSSILNSQDEVSAEEEDDYTLPDGYKFYAERIGEAEHALKKFKVTIKQAKRKFDFLTCKLSGMDQKSLQNARDTINLEFLIHQRIESFVHASVTAKDLIKKVTQKQFGSVINQIQKQATDALLENNSLESEDSVSQSSIQSPFIDTDRFDLADQEPAQYISLIQSPDLSPQKRIFDYGEHLEEEKVAYPQFESKQNVFLEQSINSKTRMNHDLSPGHQDSFKFTLPYNQETYSPANISPFTQIRQDSNLSLIRQNMPSKIFDKEQSQRRSKLATKYSRNLDSDFFSQEKLVSSHDLLPQSQKSKAESSLEVHKIMQRQILDSPLNFNTISKNQLFLNDQSIDTEDNPYGLYQQQNFNTIERYQKLEDENTIQNQNMNQRSEEQLINVGSLEIQDQKQYTDMDQDQPINQRNRQLGSHKESSQTLLSLNHLLNDAKEILDTDQYSLTIHKQTTSQNDPPKDKRKFSQLQLEDRILEEEQEKFGYSRQVTNQYQQSQ
eukprot:403369479